MDQRNDAHGNRSECKNLDHLEFAQVLLMSGLPDQRWPFKQSTNSPHGHEFHALIVMVNGMVNWPRQYTTSPRCRGGFDRRFCIGNERSLDPLVDKSTNYRRVCIRSNS